MTDENEKDAAPKKQSTYTMEDALKIADDIFKMSQEKKYNLGAFIHGLIFASEYVQYGYRIPPKQVAEIRRGCRKYFQDIENIKASNKKKE